MSSNSLSPLRVVYWTRWFNGLMFDGNGIPLSHSLWKANAHRHCIIGQDLGLNERECPIPKGYNITGEPWCTITPSLEDVGDAAGVVFHAADYYPSTVPDRKCCVPVNGLPRKQMAYDDGGGVCRHRESAMDPSNTRIATHSTLSSWWTSYGAIHLSRLLSPQKLVLVFVLLASYYGHCQSPTS